MSVSMQMGDTLQVRAFETLSIGHFKKQLDPFGYVIVFTLGIDESISARDVTLGMSDSWLIPH